MKNLFCFFVLILLVNPCIAADETPLTLETVKTYSDISKLLQQNTVRVNTALQEIAEKHGEVPSSDLLALLTQNGNFQVSVGEKLLNIGKQTHEKEEGYQVMLNGLQMLVRIEQIAAVEKLATERNLTDKDKLDVKKIQPLITEVENIDTPSAKRIREVLSEVEKDGRYNNFVGYYLVEKFVREGYKLTGEKFSQEKFDGFLNEAKKLINRNLDSLPADVILQEVYEISRSWRSAEQQSVSILGLFTSRKSAAGKQRLEKQSREILVAFINSEECTLPKDKKTAALDWVKAVSQREIDGELKLYGKLLDGTDLDWNGLLAKNKYILVEFTATWCAPCREEIPNLKKAFEKYHEKGFDIVQVYAHEYGSNPVATVKKLVDDEKLTWTIVSEHLTKQDKKVKPQSDYYAINSFPTLLLIDKTGKVIETEDLRSVELQKKLAELFGK
ncbi:MAG: TlpA family protein disulfide reductase [Planctomycetaceae bacterium]|jgi:thiol-disulfide isomerase/thioredoxin|nr:TlpA family protein disulfide reductase [Planctomycetaceae bacterium]